MPWIGPKGEAVPPHPRPEPRFEGDLTADRIRWIFRDSADFGERPVLIGGDPAKRTTVFFLNGQVRNERMNDYILRPLATSPLLREATPQAAFRMMTEGIVYTQLVQVCTTLDQAVFALINGSVVFAFPGEGRMISYFAATEEKRALSPPENEPSLKGARDSFVESLRTNTSLVRRRLRAPELKIAEVIAGLKGTYNVIKIDPAYRPAPIEHKDVFGVTFEQGRNELKIDESLLKEMPTQNKEIPADAKRDLIIALITLKYTQSNSVCYAKDGQAIGIGAGQQSRIHCTRLAGNKADIWYLRQHPKVMNLPWIEKIRRADRDNTIDVYISEDYDDVLADGIWQQFFTEKPEILTREEKRAWLDTMTGVALGSDAFFPFGDNIERAHKSGVSYIAQPGGSVRDDHVIETCDKYNMAMAFTGIRLFHH